MTCVILSMPSTLISSRLPPVDPVAQQSHLSNLAATLSQDQADLCEAYLGLEECCEALMGMARNKAPGSDGLPMQFYVKF